VRFRRRLSLVTAAAAATAIGLLPMPGEYYALVRIFFAGLGLYYVAQPAAVPDWARWALVALIVLHNPVVPIELGRGAVWAAVHIVTVAFFWWVSRRVAPASRW
jgi:hypothetical protein